jgi:endonuclease YncB( thermonuclease family)
VNSRMAFVLWLVGIPVLADAPPYDGAWRNACGNPVAVSQAYSLGPSGKVTGVLNSRTVTIATVDHGVVLFELAGLTAPESVKAALAALLTGRTVETLLETEQSRSRLVGRIENEGRDVGVQLLLSGRATFRASKDLGSYSNCLYERANRAAAATRIGRCPR